MIVSIIVAAAENLVIGKDNDLVWNLPDDMSYFKETTKGHHVLMGRKNYESIPSKWRPLPNRPNVIITRNKELDYPGTFIVHSLKEALALAEKANEDEAFIIGGGEIFSQSIPLVDRIYYTEVKAAFDGDTFFPELVKEHWNEVSRIAHASDDKHAIPFDFVIYERK
jgi:dihydrofolate reductase